MKNAQKQKKQAGFTIIELMVSVSIFIVISGAIFGLMGTSQKSFRTESQLLSSFQEARLGMDQIVRDSNATGYPPINHFSTTPALSSAYASTPVAWMPGYLTSAACTIGTAGGGTCTTPGDFDVIFEGDYNDGNGVEWIRYQLQGTTLYRGVTPKSATSDPVTATNVAGVMLPYVTNVMNNASSTRIATFRAGYPAMFPGATAQPIFQYTCDNGTGTVLCQNAGTNNSPTNVRDIEITLIVMSPQADAQTGKLRLVELNGRGHRKNPNQ
jgi:prepilin-type N-terminal cleavage/methylation domain-containing protein